MHLQELPKIINRITTHPLTKDQKTAALWRFLKWQISTRLNSKPVVHPFIGNSKLILRKGIPGATANLYVGLAECQDMSFLLHFLRSGDLFVDAGANIGSYTVLAAAVKGAQTIAIEPIPQTFEFLQENIAINDIQSLVQAKNIGLGEKPGTLNFTKNKDMQNHVATVDAPVSETLEVPVQTLDQILKDQHPALLKIDVEGYETAVIRGAKASLMKSSLQAIIIENMGIGNRYGFDEAEVHQLITAAGFTKYAYDPFKRQLIKDHKEDAPNSIYIRDIAFVEDRIKKAQSVRVLGKNL